jgi:hypothetical protein
MDARLKMSGMTGFFRHPRQESAGIHLKKAKMDSRLIMSGMTPMEMDFQYMLS